MSKLDENRIAVLNQLLENKKLSNPALNRAIRKGSQREMYPLSYEQRRLWFMTKFAPQSPMYNIPIVMRIAGKPDAGLIERAFNSVIERHEILRTLFIDRDGEPYQVVLAQYLFTLRKIDISVMSENEIMQTVFEETRSAFEIEREPPFRAALYHISDSDWILAITFHHLAADGWSMDVFLKDFQSFYCDADASPLPIQYKDFAVWQREHESEKRKADLSYWCGQFAQMPDMLEFPADRKRSAIQTSDGSVIPFSIERELCDSLKQLGNTQNATMFMILFAAYQILLHRYTSQEEIVIGTPAGARDPAETEGLIGFFVKILPLRVRLDPKEMFIHFLQLVKTTVLEAFEHQDAPFDQLVENLDIERNLNQSPLFQTMFTLQNAPLTSVSIPGMAITPIPIDNLYAQYEISITLWDSMDGRLNGTFEYNTGLFCAEKIKRMSEQFKMLLRSIVEDPRRRVSQLNILSEHEKYKLIYEYNDTDDQSFCGKSLAGLLKESVNENANLPAVIHNGRVLTYKQLMDRAEHMARKMEQAGVLPGEMIVLYGENTPEYISAVLGAVLLGVVYVPVDTGCPMQTIQYILADSSANFVLTQSGLADVFEGSGKHLIFFDDTYEVTDSSVKYQHGENPFVCVIYTSGTTGHPKGVLIRNDSLVNLTISFIKSYGCNQYDKLLSMVSVSSASFLGEIFPIFCAGGTFVLAPKEEYLDTNKFYTLIEHHKLTIISTVASMMRSLNELEKPFGSLRLLLSGGEVLSPSDVSQLKDKLTVVNGYGLTETTVCSSYTSVRHIQDDMISIGRPIINTRIYILGGEMEVLPAGGIGEIYIGGAGIAEGYLNDPVLTNNSMMPNPFVEGDVLFKTGDMGRWLENGELYYEGRKDNQVKIRGFRIQTEEIMHVIKKHEMVYDCYVRLIGDRESEPRLYAFLVLRKQCTQNAIRLWLLDKLPAHMIPAKFIELSTIPVNINGKVDYKKIEEMEWKYLANANKNNLHSTAIEKKIADIWKGVLEIEAVGLNDNFFEIGGHSLMIPKIQSRLLESLNLEISVVDLFRFPTIGMLTEMFMDSGWAASVKEQSKEIGVRAQKAKQSHQKYARMHKKQINGGNN